MSVGKGMIPKKGYNYKNWSRNYNIIKNWKYNKQKEKNK